ncbi:MAG: penicillin-binding protein 2, partial [Patescibacteria group bacterium]|nr:penicillin-binding protein 2 [Patescibacteria group bacterium]
MVKNIFKSFLRKKRKNTLSGEINPEDIFLDSSNLTGLDMDKMEGSLHKPISSTAERVPFFILLLIFSLFTFRLYNLEVKNYDFYKNKADNNRYNTHLILANRGQILDRNGKILANNIVSASSQILKRQYLEDSGIANLIGYISYPKSDSLGNYWQDDYIGKDGVEQIYQPLLSGVNGKKIIEKDVKSFIEAENIVIKAISGANLNLTIDIDLQKRLFDSIKQVVNDRGYISGTGIIMDVNTGEVLAMTNFPEYDNNLLTNATGTQDNKKISNLLKDKRTPFLNRAVSGLFTPGSVVKPFMAYAALTEVVITPDKNILSTGALIIKNPYGGPDTVFRDWKIHGYVNVVSALAASSDEYFYQVGGGYKDQKGLGIERIDKYAKLFGISTETGIDLPNEATGIIPTPDWKRINFIDGDWRVGDTYHTSIGQFGFQVTPIELIRYISSIANGGKLVTPHVFLSASSSDSESPENYLVNSFNNKIWPVIDLKLNQSNLRYIQEGMKQAVIGNNGTVPQLNFLNLKVA